MHASTRILILLVTLVAIVGGWWVLLANNTIVAGAIYGTVWTVVVLIVTFVGLKIGFGYNRFTARRSAAGAERPPSTQAALAELVRLRDEGLISTDEYESKRAAILDRL